MVDYREILRLISLRHNNTQIAETLHSSRNTIREVRILAEEKGISWPLEEELTNQSLYELLYPERLEKAQVYMEPDCACIHKEPATGPAGINKCNNKAGRPGMLVTAAGRPSRNGSALRDNCSVSP